MGINSRLRVVVLSLLSTSLLAWGGVIPVEALPGDLPLEEGFLGG